MSENANTPAIERVDWSDPFSYVREMYGVPAVKGARVTFNGEPGTVVDAYGQYVYVKLDEGEREPFMVHPHWRMEWAA